MVAVVDRVRCGRPVFSVEFLEPRDSEGERQLWHAVRALEPLDPAFVSVTYGAGGTRRDRTIRVTGRIAQETTLVPVAHLTAVNHSVAELRNVIGWYAAVGVHNVLALRGDPPGDVHGEWVPHPQGVTYAEELVRLVRELGDFCVGVAAFPYGHPRSADLETDTAHLVRKIRAGAHYAISQLFFEVDDFLRLRDRVAAQGVDLDEVPLLPGMMPISTLRGVQKMAHLAGAPVPSTIVSRIERFADDPKALRAEGVDIATEMGQRLLAEGVNALHFYTLNRSLATSRVVARLGLVPARA
ncbi:5,10-methylenetetrahydrofolate reductase (NAD(P)) [Streptoalloteichus tenebrarius]|uniref:Methylenetetrahydrofolate reductase n=1 Tax=Streptoalloteichus tenebrarius (strain ATCC 17920 / DSM 40477 / JCM 4838 / CBS 697.72 / NBRC 16177 / NCIMB 11028 / NRRL B-12390 / A12253. 1 / ISP 5477) TaxID=1933 RepID=A0ABT1HMJ7_STRSD|nr:methylenetetrahydrofolate reductase [NAD(P)H] [Streptoalloteichus tenebrarius]MCP2256739.1 5,10-methylenetetrahydrofolate reductase (NAD(P)) [Streptoalloteichus tenebrarius]BFF00359.1 methylenetetrahydrofolate reductase [Streptoalloteichus tenebrarius]